LGDQDEDPQFVDKENLDFHLQVNSPCIGTGRDSGDRGALPFEPTDIVDNSQLPAGFSLLRNYPNPFNASTSISYSLSKPSDVTISIYDMLGRLIDTINNETQITGEHSVIWNAGNFASGVYFYKITAGEFEQIKRMTLLK
jgi:hypothetical protein